MKTFLMAAAAALSLSAAAAPAHAVVIGTADSSSSMPFGDPTWGTHFQQVYSATSFAAPITIDQISFFNTVTPGGTPRTGAFDIFLSTTSEAISTFDTNPMAWPNASFTQVFSGALPSLSGGKLTFNLSNLFTYDPSAGNLMLTVRSNDFGAGNLFLDADNNTTQSNMRFSLYSYNLNQGLVTDFHAAAAAVPEPATWTMMIAGFGMAGVALRRRRESTAA